MHMACSVPSRKLVSSMFAQIALLLSRVDSLLEEIEQVSTENKNLKNDLSQVAELLELPEPSNHALKFLSSSLTTFDPSVPIITTTRPTAITLMELGDQEFETATTTKRERCGKTRCAYTNSGNYCNN